MEVIQYACKKQEKLFKRIAKKFVVPIACVTFTHVVTATHLSQFKSSTTKTHLNINQTDKKELQWTGFYAGVNAGYNFPNSKLLGISSETIQYCTVAQGCNGGDATSSASTASAARSVSVDNSGFIGGGQLGYSRSVINNFVIGLETDIQGIANAKKNNSSVSSVDFITPAGNQNISTDLVVSKNINYVGTLRGRLGYFLSPSVFIAGSGGLAYGNVNSATNIQQSYGAPAIADNLAKNWGSVGTYSSTRIGWVAASNLEWMFLSNWSVKAEYLYYDLGAVTYSDNNLINIITIPNNPQNFFTNGVSTTTRFDGHIIRVGLNYHFL